MLVTGSGPWTRSTVISTRNEDNNVGGIGEDLGGDDAESDLNLKGLNLNHLDSTIRQNAGLGTGTTMARESEVDKEVRHYLCRGEENDF